MTLIDVVPWPLAMVAPVGTVHVYVVAPLTLEIEYVTLLAPALTELDPLIEPAAPTPVTVTPKLEAVPLQLPFEGVTVTLPELAEQA